MIETKMKRNLLLGILETVANALLYALGGAVHSVHDSGLPVIC